MPTKAPVTGVNSLVDEDDARYLKAIEHEPFVPIGWLYTSIYDRLTEAGLVIREGGSYFISPKGRADLTAFLAGRAKP